MKVYYTLVANLLNLKSGKVYSTTNYKMFSGLTNNRGKFDSVSNDKVNEFIEKIKSDQFFLGTIHVLVNTYFTIVDGHHKAEALARLGLPINFVILNEPKFNVEDQSVLLNNVSDFNSVTSKWSALDSFNSALNLGEKCAKAIANLKDSALVKFPELSKCLTYTRIRLIADNFALGFANQSLPRTAYCNDQLAETINSETFQKEFEYICQILMLAKEQANGKLREWDVIKTIAKNHKDFTYESIFKYVQKVGFDGMENYRKSAIDTKVRLIFVEYTKGNKYI